MTRRTKWHVGTATLSLVALSALFAPMGGCAAGPGVGEDPAAEDLRITAEVLRVIAEQDDLVAADIEVETNDGVVVLTGIQTELGPVSELLQRVARVRGVVEVVNRIRILRSAHLDRIRAVPAGPVTRA